MKLILLLQAAATWFMVGVIWYAQIVHYPLLARIGLDSFAAYQVLNMGRTGWVVIPAMLAEAVTALVILWSPPTGVSFCLPTAGLGLLVLIWASTFLLQVSRHKVLTRGFDAEAHRYLVRTNWIRTAAWSARGIVVLWMIVEAA